MNNDDHVPSPWTTAYRSDLPERPLRIRSLPVYRGFPVPWFVAEIHGAPDFRVIRAGAFETATRFKLCWICGDRLGAFQAFTIGPMCAINRTSGEPPAHRSCAVYAATACPFLTRPDMKRSAAEKPEGARYDPAMIARNPGVCLVWITKSYEVWSPRDAGASNLITVGPPVEVLWYREGRPATRAEVEASIASGFPALEAAARRDGREAYIDLRNRMVRARELLPAH